MLQLKKPGFWKALYLPEMFYLPEILEQASRRELILEPDLCDLYGSCRTVAVSEVPSARPLAHILGTLKISCTFIFYFVDQNALLLKYYLLSNLWIVFL